MKLEIKHLSPYLPYGLKLINIKSGRILTMQYCYKKTDLYIKGIEYTTEFDLSICSFKPLLYKLDYIKLIMGNIIPAEKGYSCKYFFTHDKKRGYLSIVVHTYFTDEDVCFYPSKIPDYLKFTKAWSKKIVILTDFKIVADFKYLEILLEKNIDVFGLIEKGLAVDINTLSVEWPINVFGLGEVAEPDAQ